MLKNPTRINTIKAVEEKKKQLFSAYVIVILLFNNSLKVEKLNIKNIKNAKFILMSIESTKSEIHSRKDSNTFFLNEK